MTAIRILVENCRGWYDATAFDEIGRVCAARDASRTEAINRAKARAVAKLDTECEFIVVDRDEE